MLTRLANVIYWAVSGLAVIVALFALQTAYEYPHAPTSTSLLEWQ
jgi:hypothetical protein